MKVTNTELKAISKWYNPEIVAYYDASRLHGAGDWVTEVYSLSRSESGDSQPVVEYLLSQKLGGGSHKDIELAVLNRFDNKGDALREFRTYLIIEPVTVVDARVAEHENPIAAHKCPA